MIDKNEMLFVVDENNKPLESLPRHIVHTEKLWHRTSGIWVISRTGKILCQKRSLKKDLKPGFWEAFFGGHVGPTGTYLQNARREVEEELGVAIDEKDLIPYKILKSDKPTHKEFQHVFALVLIDENNSFSFEEEEIDEITWKSFAEVRRVLIETEDAKWVHKPWDKEVLDWLHTLATSDFIL